MKREEYSYTVRGHHVDGQGYVNKRHVRATLALDLLERPRLSMSLPTASRDLLRVAGAVWAADRLSPRCGAATRGVARELSWPRRINLSVAVDDVSRWQGATDRLLALLRFMTDDDWNLDFNAARREPRQSTLQSREMVEANEVSLFSGGLDSMLGALVRSQEHPIVGMSHAATAVRVAFQRAAARAVNEHGGSLRWLSARAALHDVAVCAPQRVRAPPARLVETAAASRRRIQEPSARSRGFLFLASAGVIAVGSRIPTIASYETGIGALNTRLTDAQTGAQVTRSVHPRVILETEAILHHVLSDAVAVELPFMAVTKAELCQQAGNALAAFAERAFSCDEGEGHRKHPIHCGACSSCLFRRIALHRALAGADPTRYRDAFSSDRGVHSLMAYEIAVSQLTQIARSFQDIRRWDPDVMSGAAYLMKQGRTEAQAWECIRGLFARHAVEAATFMRNAKPTLSRWCPSPDERNSGDLFAATR